MNKLLQELAKREQDNVIKTSTRNAQSDNINNYTNRLLLELERNVELFAQKLARTEMSLRLYDLLRNINEIPPSQHSQVVQRVLDHIYGYGIIQKLMDDPEVSDIQIAGNQYIRYVKDGERKIFDYTFESDDDVNQWVQRKLKGTPFRFDRSNARTDAFLADGSRLHVKGEVVGVQRLDEKTGKVLVKPCTIVTIRKFLGFFTLEQLWQEKKLFDERAYLYLYLASLIRYGFVLSGGTGSGKTTLMNALISKTPEDKQIGILEEAPELQPIHPFVMRYWERQENTEGKGRIGTDINLKDVLRMFIDDLYVGEVRDAVMSYQFLQAANTGSGRVGTTLHAKSALGAVKRLHDLASGSPERLGSNAIWSNIRNTIDMVIQIQRFKGKRRITEIAEVDPEKDQGEVRLIPVFTFEWTGVDEKGLPDGRLRFHGLTKNFLQECAKWGIVIPKELREADVA
ncbi:pilus assembly protein CpaF [Collibacillus ludicampi]|uniref:Pilus assembly protein CpaF n=1 Tax=Collibacillus ludicampi TaxID=2771369 RepID=A0AAV4LN28_9BACL|nr:ATPase, T2SS/T4P/T4SS family [Collibacillus ludicampi]GIM48447.1 pilus assembly protein CpaF [Collibacillus ludicampi]